MVIYPPRDEQIPLEPPVNFMLRRRSSSLPAHHPAVYASPLSNIATTPEEVSESSSSVHDEEVSLPAAPTSSVPSMSAIEATMYDNVVHTVEENRDSGSTGGSGQETPGMSKQEFDRQMLKLVEELKPQSTPDLDEGHSPPHNIHESLSKAIPEGIAGDVEAPGSSDENETLAKTQASRGVDPSTIDYWRGSREPETAPYGGREGESTQGVRSRAASEDTIDNDYGRILEHRVPYSYHGPSVPHSNDEPDTASSYGKRFTNGNPIPISTAEAVRTQEADNGAPPLTPLRELMEAAHDTSDEASSLAPSQDASRSDYAPSERFHNSDLPKTGPFSSRNTSLAKPVAKLSDLRSQLPAVTTGIERAAVQRVMPSPVSAREPFTPVGRTSTSSNHDLRPIHTSGSGTSQVSQKLKGLVGRDSSDSRRPGTPRRSLEGSGSMASDIRYSRTPKAEDAQRNFDQLIKSDETIQYTLTPQSMREMEVCENLKTPMLH